MVLVAMACHTMTLIGNLSASDGFHIMGQSTKGWSNVGIGLAEAFDQELAGTLGNVSDQFTQSIEIVMSVQESIDQALASLGTQTDEALLRLSLAEQGVSFGATHGSGVPPEVQASIPEALDKVNKGLTTFLDKMEPPLLQVGVWYEKFGDKLQAGVEMFGITIDVVQKLFDGIMSGMNGGAGGNDPYMELNTFTLFALTDKENGIMVQDLKDVANIYSITALQGSKAEQMFALYDVNKDGFIDETEYLDFVIDDSLPNVMALVLRQYSKKLAQVAGEVRGAVMRDAVANAVVHYLQLVCAKNMTKVGWISDVLTNGTLPQPFTADIMRNLALAVDDPDVLTTTDVGATVIGTMTELNAQYTMDSADLMADPDFWVSEGFDPADQEVCVERVSKWTATSLIQTGSTSHLKDLHQRLGGEAAGPAVLLDEGAGLADRLGVLARERVRRNRAGYLQRKREEAVSRYYKLRRSRASRFMFDSMFGGASVARIDPMAVMAVNSGVPAKPETIQFAQWLANNATVNSGLFLLGAFNYSAQSSTATDSMATQVKGMSKKIQAFLKMLGEYSGPEGVARLRAMVEDFAANGEAEISKSLELYVSSYKGMPSEHATALLQGKAIGRQAPNETAPNETAPSDVAPSTGDVVEVLELMSSILPQVLTNLKQANKDVNSVGSAIKSIFDTFEEKGPEIFDKIAFYYAAAWIAYFVLLTIFTLFILYYGLWASGCCGEGPKHTSDRFCPEYEPPASCWDRLCCCWHSCCHCLYHTTETEYCFWSMILLGQLFVLVLFLVSVVLCILAGVNMFLTSGCAAIYVLGDPKVCTETLKMIQDWLTTYNPSVEVEIPIDEACTEQELMTCDIMKDKMLMAAILTAVGAIAAAVVSFQMLIECAILHERARNRRMIDKMLQEDEKKSLKSQSP